MLHLLLIICSTRLPKLSIYSFIKTEKRGTNAHSNPSGVSIEFGKDLITTTFALAISSILHRLSHLDGLGPLVWISELETWLIISARFPTPGFPSPECDKEFNIYYVQAFYRQIPVRTYTNFSRHRHSFQASTSRECCWGGKRKHLVACQDVE